jgi:hypothetical protein
MELKGRIKVIKEVQIISEKFAKREFVITIPDGNYPQDIVMEMTNDNCGILDSYNVGDEVNAEVNLRGREWTNPKDGEVRYFNTLQAWRLSKVGSTNEGSPQGMSTKTQSDTTQFEEEQDDLPF